MRIGFPGKRPHSSSVLSESRIGKYGMTTSNQKAALCTSVDIRHKSTGTYFILNILIGVLCL